MRTQARAIAATLALTLGGSAGCAGRHESFAAAERQSMLATDGYVAAQYDALVAGDVIGDVKVWSSGAFVDERSGRTLLHVGFELENNSGAPYELPAHEVAIEGATTNGVMRQPVELYYQDGDGRVDAGRQARLELWFAMPVGVEPQHLDAFQVRWAVRNPEGRYAQRTPFTEYEPPTGYVLADSAYYYHSPWYDPFLYAPPLSRVTVVHPMPYYYHHAPAGPRRHR
jgi:hypothetical protein